MRMILISTRLVNHQLFSNFIVSIYRLNNKISNWKALTSTLINLQPVRYPTLKLSLNPKRLIIRNSKEKETVS